MTTKKTARKADDQLKDSGTATVGSTSKPETDDQDNISQQLETLSEALQDDLSSIAPETASTMIDEWHSLVQKAKTLRAKEIASGLKELQKLFKRDDVAGHELGELLSHLGEQTSEIAAEADKGLKASLQHLAKQLAKVGKSLAKAENQQQLEALDELTEMLSEEADEIDPASAIAEVDHWYSLLHKSEDESLQEIASDLKELKQILKGSKTKAADLSQKLIDLGEQTTEAAGSAAKGFKGAIKTLGKALIKLGESIKE